MRGVECHNPRKECRGSQRICKDDAGGFRKVFQLARLYLLIISTSEPRVLCEIERALRRGASTPHTKHGKENIEGHMLEINQILGVISRNGVFLTSPSLILRKD